MLLNFMLIFFSSNLLKQKLAHRNLEFAQRKQKNGLGSGAIPRVLHRVQLLSMIEIDSCKKQLSISTID